MLEGIKELGEELREISGCQELGVITIPNGNGEPFIPPPPPMPGEGTWRETICERCSSKLRFYDNPSLGPEYNISAKCPVCGADLGVESVRGEVQILEAKPWPVPVAGFTEWLKKYAPWLIVADIVWSGLIWAIVAKKKI